MPGSARNVFIFLLLLLLVGSKAFAQGWGRVGMRGAIIETACAIDTMSRDQAIQMGLMPVNQVIRDGVGLSRPFVVKLVNCSLSRSGSGSGVSAGRHFQVTFDGPVDGDFFGVAGDAQGVALRIADGFGHVAVPGKPLPLGALGPRDKVLNYSMRLVGNKRELRVGDYYSTIRFKMDYY